MQNQLGVRAKDGMNVVLELQTVMCSTDGGRNAMRKQSEPRHISMNFDGTLVPSNAGGYFPSGDLSRMLIFPSTVVPPRMGYQTRGTHSRRRHRCRYE